MIYFSSSQRTKRSRARNGQPLLASSAVRRQRKYSGLTGKQTRKIKNEHRRHRKGIDKTNIHWTNKPTRKDVTQQKKRLAASAAKRRKRRWF